VENGRGEDLLSEEQKQHFRLQQELQQRTMSLLGEIEPKKPYGTEHFFLPLFKQSDTCTGKAEWKEELLMMEASASITKGSREKLEHYNR
jgi:hypothetical protein